MIEITGLFIYPVKSLKGISLNTSQLTPLGLPYDRNWMIIDQNSSAITQREIPNMAMLEVTLNSDQLIISYQNANQLVINLHKDLGEKLSVTIWKDTCFAFDEGIYASDWLSKILGHWKDGPLRLVRFSRQDKRSVETDFLDGTEAYTLFSDAYPFLIASESSLENLNSQLANNNAETIGIDRFRPNLLIKGLEAFKEHELNYLISEDNQYKLKLCKPCQRCKITTINQQTANINNPKEPLKTLLKTNPREDLHGAFFGENAILLSGQSHKINVGDHFYFE